MVYSDKERSFKDFFEIINSSFKQQIEEEKLYNLHQNIYNLNELVHIHVNNNDTVKYYNEMLRNIFEAIFLGTIAREVPSYHMIRSVLELFAKIEISRGTNCTVKRKFSENIDLFIKNKKQGNKATKRIIVSAKDALKNKYHELCEIVHTGENINIKNLEVMEEIFVYKKNQECFVNIVDKINEILVLLIKIDLMAHSNFYFNKMSSAIFSDYKNQYLDSTEKYYSYLVTENN